MFTSQRGSSGGDDDSGHHADGRDTIPQHKHADAQREERQAAFEHDVHGQAEATERPQSQSGLQRGEDTHWGKLLHRDKQDAHTSEGVVLD